MKVLVACEYSGVVRDAFRKRGHDAWSCDIIPTERDPTYHIQTDVLNILNDGWELMIAHPPCTYLSNSGVSWLHKDPTRWGKMEDGAIFFRKLLYSDISKIAVENPIQHKYAKEIIGQTYSQIIQPFWFGHPESKATCLWLKNLPILVPTNIIEKPESGHWENQTKSGQNKLGPSKDRWKIRSRTYEGIAEAMAQQWG